MGMKIRFLGDVHGQFEFYVGDRDTAPGNTIQVGDFGVGFGIPAPENPDPLRHRFIRGNHDNPALCRETPGYIEDGSFQTLLNGLTMMFVGGALSIDAHRRIPGVSWWEDEELSYTDLGRMIEAYCTHLPDIMVTHEVPESIAREIYYGSDKVNRYPSRTRMAFQTMLDEHQPRNWFYGHWHSTRFDVMGHTSFCCIGANDFVDVEF
jgi:hypothetical protein